MFRIFSLRCVVYCLISVTHMAVFSQIPSNYVPLNPIVSNPIPETIDVLDSLSDDEDDISDPESDIDENYKPEVSNQKTIGKGSVPTGAVLVLQDNRLKPDAPHMYGQNYPGINRSAIQHVLDTQQQYQEPLASEDVLDILGVPYSESVRGTEYCSDGEAGQVVDYLFVIKENPFPRTLAIARFCNDGFQKITTRTLR